jgi:hypothetical protein
MSGRTYVPTTCEDENVARKESVSREPGIGTDYGRIQRFGRIRQGDMITETFIIIIRDGR